MVYISNILMQLNWIAIKFLWHQEGVTICNENFTESEERVITFCENERITSDETLAKVTSVKWNAHLICLINDKIYIFS